MKPGVVLDKNFLQGGTAAQVMNLAVQYTLIMPWALFYELLTTSAEARIKCFSKLPPVDNPVELIDHIGTLLRHEIKTNSSCGLPPKHCHNLRFYFNRHLLDIDYKMPLEAEYAIKQHLISHEAQPSP